MSKIKCIIIEDEPLAQERVRGYVSKIPNLELVGSFENGIDALFFLKSNEVDLLFLDINIGEFNGIQFAETLKNPIQIIITTAYPEYALKGFDLNVTDYLLKPFTFDRFIQAVERVQLKSVNEVKAAKSYIFIKTEYRLEKVFLKDIIYIEGMRDYRRIHTIDKKIMTLQTFKELEDEIPSSVVCRVHKSYMVGIDKIESIERDRLKIMDVLIPISETYKKSFFELINS
jgi:two-component system LytT family response regulator